MLLALMEGADERGPKRRRKRRGGRRRKRGRFKQGGAAT
jgi:hypothetical protein